MSMLAIGDLHEGQILLSPTRTVTEAELIAYAREFDPQPMHTDPVAAAIGPMRGLIASGWLTAAIGLRLQEQAGLPAAPLVAIESLGWPQPTRPGDTLRAAVEILALDRATGRVRFRNTVSNAAGAAMQTMLGTVVLPR